MGLTEVLDSIARDIGVEREVYEAKLEDIALKLMRLRGEIPPDVIEGAGLERNFRHLEHALELHKYLCAFLYGNETEMEGKLADAISIRTSIHGSTVEKVDSPQELGELLDKESYDFAMKCLQYTLCATTSLESGNTVHFEIRDRKIVGAEMYFAATPNYMPLQLMMLREAVRYANGNSMRVYNVDNILLEEISRKSTGTAIESISFGDEKGTELKVDPNLKIHPSEVPNVFQKTGMIADAGPEIIRHKAKDYVSKAKSNV